MPNHTRRGTAALLVIAFAAVVGACSGAAPTPPGAATPTAATSAVTGVGVTPPAATAQSAATAGSDGAATACTIVTKDDVATATGFSIATTAGSGPICYYQNTQPAEYLTVWLYGSQAEMAPMLQIESASEHVAGLGDDAFWNATGGILFVRKGDHGMELVDPSASFGAGGAPTRDRMITLARTALPRL